MRLNHKLFLPAICTVFFIALTIGNYNFAKADTVNVALSPAIQSGAAGSILTFRGQFTNPSIGDANKFSIGASINPLFSDISFASTPTTVLGNSSTGMIELFYLTIKPDVPAGTIFGGIYSINYRSALTGLITYSQSPFQINVQAAPVPEPTSMFLLGSGIAALVTRLRKRSLSKN